MTVKATVHTEPRGSLCSIRCQPSAAESCSAYATHTCRPPPYALRPSADGPEQSRHSVHATECRCRDCSGAGVHELWARGGGLVLCAAQTCSVIVDSKVAVGRRRRHQAGMRRCRPQRRPEEPCLASVGSGMAAGAAFGHPRVRGARVRPNFLNHL